MRPVPVPRSSSERVSAGRRARSRRASTAASVTCRAADAIPFGGVLAEVVCGGGRARGAHCGQAAAIAQHDRIGGIEPPNQHLRDVGDAAALRRGR